MPNNAMSTDPTKAPMSASSSVTSALMKMIAHAPTTLVNQYTTTFEQDGPLNGAGLRTANIDWYLKQRSDCRVLLVSQAPGQLGARWSGIPLTDTQMIADGRLGSGYDYTHLASEPSSRAVHAGLGDWHEQVLLWSVVPWHPAGQTPDSNRKPTDEEIAAGTALLSTFVTERDFDLIVGLGAVAHAVLTALGISSERLPHPFYDGTDSCTDAIRDRMERYFYATR